VKPDGRGKHASDQTRDRTPHDKGHTRHYHAPGATTHKPHRDARMTVDSAGWLWIPLSGRDPLAMGSPQPLSRKRATAILGRGPGDKA